MEIPECLVPDILIRLPITSVLRFRVVCKFWYAILSNPEFLHTDLFTVDPDDQILYKHHQDQTDEVFSLISFNNPDHISAAQKLPLVEQAAGSTGYTVIAGCCPVKRWFGNVPLESCNRGDEGTKVLPELKLFHDRDDDFERTFHDVGLCFDAKTSDFKVILVFGPIYNVHERDFVYSLRSDSWKIVEARSPERPLYDDMYEIAMNSSRGMCHWFGSYRLGKRRCKEAILSFDATREIFITTTLPHKDLYPYLQRDCDRGFFMLKDYVAMFHIGWEGWGETFEIWAVVEVGVKESWMKVMSIGPTVPFRKVLRFWTKRKVFLYTSGEHEEAVATLDILTGQASLFLRNTDMFLFRLATNYKKSQVRLEELCARAGKLH